MAKCTNKNIGDLLPWYVNQTLSEQEQDKVRQHQQECPQCSDKLENMNWLSSNFKLYQHKLQTEHIPSELLVTYAEAKHELTTKQIQHIQDHVALCSSCKNELEILEKVTYPQQTSFELTLVEKIKQRIYELGSKFLAKPQLAYVIIILLLLYPAYYGLFKSGGDIRKLQQPQVAQIVYQLNQTDMRTGEAHTNEIQIPTDTEIFSLSFTIPVLMSEQIRYDASIIDAKGESIWQKTNVKSIDDYGSMLLICYSSYFLTGEYQLNVQEINTATGVVQSEFLFPFVVKK